MAAFVFYPRGSIFRASRRRLRPLSHAGKKNRPLEKDCAKILLARF
jgi:hypothetical protein